MGSQDSTIPEADPPAGGRRRSDRRQGDAPVDGPDRRGGERRSGADRRTNPRNDGAG